MEHSVILSAARTPVGSFQGLLSQFSAVELGSVAIKEAVKRSSVDPKQIDYCIMGCVLSAGLGQAPARQAAIRAGLLDSTEAMTINKVCGSGLMSLVIADQMITMGECKTAVAGGMESMSNAPYLLPKVRSGLRLGNSEVIDSLINEGLWDAHTNQHMGSCADMCSKEKGMTRQDQDEYAIESYKRAISATEKGLFKDEIVPMRVKQKGDVEKIVDKDEGPFKADFEKMKRLRPAFSGEGAITAANASSINDGAAALIMTSADCAKKFGFKPMARIVSYSTHSHEPKWFTTAPVNAIEKALKKAGLRIGDIDLFEINEAFSCVAMHAMRELKIPHDRLNINGGAVAIGHPIGASGARILTTLLYAMKRRNAKRGLASLCIGGGEGIAMIVETL